MKEVSLTVFRSKKLPEILAGECLKVTGDNELAFYVVVKPEEVMKDRIEGLCSLIDQSRGF